MSNRGKLNRHFLTEVVKTARCEIKKYLSSLLIMKMQIKVRVRYLTPLRIICIQKSGSSKGVRAKALIHGRGPGPAGYIVAQVSGLGKWFGASSKNKE